MAVTPARGPLAAVALRGSLLSRPESVRRGRWLGARPGACWGLRGREGQGPGDLTASLGCRILSSGSGATGAWKENSL